MHSSIPQPDEGLVHQEVQVGMQETLFVVDPFTVSCLQVMRPIAKGEQTKAKFLTYQDPPGSSYAVVNSSTMISYVGDVVRKVALVYVTMHSC